MLVYLKHCLKLCFKISHKLSFTVIDLDGSFKLSPLYSFPKVKLTDWTDNDKCYQE